MNQRVLNWGLLSTARINQALIPALRASPRSRLAAVASRTEGAAEAYAQQWNIPRAHGSYEGLLSDPEIDVVYNSLPNHMHAEWTIKALKAGKHVLCEKPLALSVAEVDAMALAARDASKVLSEAFMYRHHPQTLKVKEIVDRGSLGTLRLITGSFTFTLNRKDDIRLAKAMGGGSIWDVGCYPINYARLIVGQEPVAAFGRQFIGEGGVDEAFVGQLEFPGHVFAQFDCGFNSAPRSHMEIVGTEGVLDIPEPFKPGIKEKLLLSRGDKTEVIKVPGQELYSGEVEDMAEAVVSGRPGRIGLADSRGNTAAILALIESAETGRSRRL